MPEVVGYTTVLIEMEEETMPPNPKFEADGCYLEYNYSKTYAGQTLEVPKGTVVDVHVRVHNQGDFGKIAIQAYDCLLYTSPSPRDISGSRMPSSA